MVMSQSIVLCFVHFNMLTLLQPETSTLRVGYVSFDVAGTSGNLIVRSLHPVMVDGILIFIASSQ